MAFADNLNALVDEIREDLVNMGGLASQLSKDKTRAYQFLAPVDVLEKVIKHIL